MQIERIRAQIEEATSIEQRTGMLHRAVVNLAEFNGVNISEFDVLKVIDFVTEYIEHAAKLMMIIEESAAMNGAQPDIQPILDATEDYFFAPDDIIPDHYGLVGLLDDAYLTYTLMESISEVYEGQTGISMLPIEAYQMNAFIRRLIGDPFVNLLDEHVSTTLENLSADHDMNRFLVVLAQMNLSSIPHPALGHAHVARITGARIEAMGKL